MGCVQKIRGTNQQREEMVPRKKWITRKVQGNSSQAYLPRQWIGIHGEIPRRNSENEQNQKSADNNKEVIKEESVNRALSIARYNKLRNNIDIPESDLILLADARSKAVKGFLANEAEVEANRLFLLNTQHDLHTEFSGVELTLEAK